MLYSRGPVMRATSGGQAWTLANSGLPFSKNPDSLAVTAISNKVYAGFDQSRLFVTTTGGL